jgi:hypothetical protein
MNESMGQDVSTSELAIKLIIKMAALDKNMLFADGFHDAVIGMTYRDDELVALYSKDKVIEILQRDHEMSLEDAFEYFDYNIEGSYVGKKTPIFHSDDIYFSE